MISEVSFRHHSGSFSVSHRKAPFHHMQTSHLHHTYEIYYLMKGKREFFIQDRMVEISEGDMVIVSPNILHRTTNGKQEAHERLIINIEQQELTEALYESDVLRLLREADYLILHFPLKERLVVEGFVQALIAELEQRQDGFEFYMRAIVTQLLIFSCRHAKTNGKKEVAVEESPIHDTILQIVRYINQHYMDSLTLQKVADVFFISPYYLSRFFKEVTGFSYVEYINNVRVKEAKHLIELSTLPISSIAKKVGFGSVTNFGRVFKLVTGQAPLYYRKKVEQKEY